MAYRGPGLLLDPVPACPLLVSRLQGEDAG
jgi:hypothetical protein